MWYMRLKRIYRHTVEELQGFSNARTPSPPWVHLVRLVVPMSCCDAAAQHLITALGGDQVCKRVVGGTKWWQVRGVRGCVFLCSYSCHADACGVLVLMRNGSPQRRIGRQQSEDTGRRSTDNDSKRRIVLDLQRPMTRQCRKRRTGRTGQTWMP
jgi:hypothetical protein